MGVRVLTAALAVMLLAGCGGDDAPPSIPRGVADWTFLVYMDADNDLEQFGTLNMNQMETVGSTERVAFAVQFDRIPGGDTSNGDWTGALRFVVQPDNNPSRITSPVLQNLGEVDMADPASLRDFLTWGVVNFPAERTALVLWNHGSGWRQRAGRGVIFDDTSGTFMDMLDLEAGLTAPTVGLDLIAFDASLMGMLEVAYQIRGRAPLINASEESPPGTGYPYDTIASRLVANPAMTPEELGRVIVAEHILRYPNQPVTQSLLVTAALPEFAAKVDAFALALLDALPAHHAQIEQARQATQAYKLPYYRDLFDFAAKVRERVPDPAVQAAAAAVMQGLTNGGPVIADRHQGLEVAGSHGLSIYLPGPGQLSAGYANLAFTRDFPNWSRFITRLVELSSGA